MADALDLDALERAITGEDGLDPVPWVRAESVLIIIARCRAAEQRAADAEAKLRRYRSPEIVWPTLDCDDNEAAPRAEATPERVILTEDPTTGAIETAAGASTPAEDPAK